jgi:hypothetical protein
MTPKLFEPSRRVLLAAAAAVGASSALQSVARASSDYFAADAIRPFRIEISEDALADLRSRIARTRWPERETVADQSQGVQLATLQKLAAYWATDYDWREIETRLNALPQFITEIDGLDIQFIHVRSVQPNALPLIVTHGWPGSIIEQLKIVGPLTNPVAHGGSASYPTIQPEGITPGSNLAGNQQLAALRSASACFDFGGSTKGQVFSSGFSSLSRHRFAPSGVSHN